MRCSSCAYSSRLDLYADISAISLIEHQLRAFLGQAGSAAHRPSAAALSIEIWEDGKCLT